jgi:hypothetical protein
MSQNIPHKKVHTTLRSNIVLSYYVFLSISLDVLISYLVNSEIFLQWSEVTTPKILCVDHLVEIINNS